MLLAVGAGSVLSRRRLPASAGPDAPACLATPSTMIGVIAVFSMPLEAVGAVVLAGLIHFRICR